MRFLGSKLSFFQVTLILCLAGSSPQRVQAQGTLLALQSRPNIGVGLEGLSDWSRAKMFSDAMKTSRRWGKPDRPWEHGVKTDTLGWPTEDAGIVVIADTPNIGGTYKLFYEGIGEATNNTPGVKVENLRFDAATKTSTADVVVPETTTSLMLTFRGTQGGVKNVRLLRPGTQLGSTFTPAFLEKLAPFSTLRFMDFLSTNNNPLQHWEDRPTIAHATQAGEKGGALEYVVELANEAGKDIWVNVPDQADDNYIRQMALLLKNGLQKERMVYVEFSNEVWNWQFQQATRNLEAAKAEGKVAGSPLNYDGSDNEGYWAMRRIAKRSAEVGQIFREAFADTAFERVRPVYATQAVYEEVFKQGLEFLEHQYKEPHTQIYGLASAPYFNLNEEENKRGDITPSEILAVLPQRIDESLWQVSRLSSYARYYGLKHLAYEGGPHLQDHFGNGSADAKVAANRDPKMGELVEKYLRGWNAQGGDLFMYFTLSGGYSKWGSWGLTEDMTQSSPKYEAAVRVATSPPVPLTLGALPNQKIEAGNFLGSNRWDKQGAPEITIEPEKWVQYAVRIEKGGDYTLTAQITANSKATAEIWSNGQQRAILETKAAESAATAKLTLEPGLNVIRFCGKEGRFQLKSFKIETTQ
jgi:hypothetical protein